VTILGYTALLFRLNQATQANTAWPSFVGRRNEYTVGGYGHRYGRNGDRVLRNSIGPGASVGTDLVEVD